MRSAGEAEHRTGEDVGEAERSLYPCARAGVRYASKRGGSQWQIHALNPAQKDGAQPHAFPGRSTHTARGASAPRALGRHSRPLDLPFARAQRARIPRASEARSAGTARRRQTARGETRAARHNAKRESPARSEAQGDVQACEAEDTPRRKATPCHGWNGERLQENNGEKGEDIQEPMDRKARKDEPGGFRRRA